MFLTAPGPRLRGFLKEGGHCPPERQALDLPHALGPSNGSKLPAEGPRTDGR